ncbi:response regulator transcription factor [Nonomuraea polychroma]|uniref:response regulator transcription factor n=1 Tax=Nonomuraea polychroma TaxID=46176 RepID=UPI003D944862
MSPRHRQLLGAEALHEQTHRLSLADRLADRCTGRDDDVLTPRERQVLELLVEGMSNKQIALRISQHGVKRLVSNVLAKLNCPNRTMAVRTAITDGILSKA